MEGRQFWTTEQSVDRNKKAKHSKHLDKKIPADERGTEEGR